MKLTGRTAPVRCFLLYEDMEKEGCEEWRVIMRFAFTDFLYAMSFALDAVEHEFTGATAEHGKRVAWLSMKMLEGTSAGGLA